MRMERALTEASTVPTRRRHRFRWVGGFLGFVLAAVGTFTIPQVQGFVTARAADWGGAATDCNRQSTMAGYDDYATMFPGSTKVTPARTVNVIVERSDTASGRVDLKLTTNHPKEVHAELLLVGGIYGQPRSYDFLVKAGDAGKESPAEGACETWATWRKWDAVDPSGSSDNTWVIAGAWGQRTYCFTLISAADWNEIASGEGALTEPMCAVATWDPSWGWMASPPK